MMIEMPPNNQQPGTPSPPPGQFDSSQFDFIMNPPQPKKSLFGSSDPKQRLLIMVAGVGIGLILIILLFSLIFGSGGGAVDKLVPIAQRQTEIIRIAEQGVNNAGGEQAKKLAVVTSAVIGTDQQALVTYMANNGRKVNNKELALKKNSETDTELESAEQNGRFDDVFTRITLEQLETYQQELQNAFPDLGEQGKKLLQDSSTNVELILKDNSVSTQ